MFYLALQQQQQKKQINVSRNCSLLLYLRIGKQGTGEILAVHY